MYTSAAIKDATKYLNTLDLLPYIEMFKNSSNDFDVYALRDYLEEKYPYEDGYSATLFDCFDAEDIVNYLKERYHLNIRENIEVKYYFI